MSITFSKKHGRYLAALLLVTSSLVAAHEKAEHPPRLDEQGFEILDAGPSPEILGRINREYLSRIRPIFREKCFDCHTTETRFPWYYAFALPGARQLIDYDIREAKKHLDLTRDFPFEGHHGTAADNLKALERVVRENRMPLWRYRLLHWGSGLATDEKDKILEWVHESQTIVNTGEEP